MRKEAHGRTCSVAAENPRVKPVDNFTGVGLGNLKKPGKTRLYKFIIAIARLPPPLQQPTWRSVGFLSSMAQPLRSHTLSEDHDTRATKSILSSCNICNHN